MIPGQWDGARRASAAAVMPPAPAAARPSHAMPSLRRELPAWVRVSSFATILLFAMWLMMWVESTTR
jgi:hypothetical protein